MSESMIAARPSKMKSTWDRNAALSNLRNSQSEAVDRLFGDASNPPRNAKAIRMREAVAAYQPPPAVKPEGYEMMTNRPEMFQSLASSRSARSVRYTARGAETARVRDMPQEKGMSKKKADFGSGHPMWSPYYRPTGRTADGKPIIPIDYFKQSSRDIGAFKTDPNLTELGPKMMLANHDLAATIATQMSFNPYPHHLSVTPRDSAGRALVKKKDVSNNDIEKMCETIFVSERPLLDRDEDFTSKFTKHFYSQQHKQTATLADAGQDPFKLSAEEMFKMKNEAKYSSKFVGPCMDMGHRPDWAYNELHGAQPGSLF
jgi:hypothetical protein